MQQSWLIIVVTNDGGLVQNQMDWSVLLNRHMNTTNYDQRTFFHLNELSHTRLQLI